MENQITMEAKIAEVHDYFKGKILENLFEVIEMTKWTIKILIDRKYVFHIWTANVDIVSSIDVFNSTTVGNCSFMTLEFSKTEKKQLQFIFKNIITKNEKEANAEKIFELKAELEKFQKKQHELSNASYS